MNLHKLTNLRHLDFRHTQVTEMPKHMEKLRNLQVLSSFIVGKCRDTDIKQLKELNLRGTVSILDLQNVVSPTDASEINLKSKIYMEKLKLGWSMNNDAPEYDRDVLEKLQPHKNLKKLSISHYSGFVFPYWFADGSLFNLVSLKLRNCRNCLSLPSLDLLLPSLEFLSLIGMEALEAWKFENISGAFPRLQELSIVKCPNLKENLPEQLPSLRKLIIEDCEQLVASVPKAPCLGKLVLRDCGKLQLECLPSTLKVLQICGILPEIFSAEKIDNAFANSCLEELRVLDCAHLELPLRHCHNFLVKLRIKSSCHSLKSLPLDLFPMLQILDLMECINLEVISVSGEHKHPLTELYIRKCPKFVSIPSDSHRTHTLFPSLQNLEIRSCPQVESFLEGGFPSNLKYIRIEECPKLMASRMEWDLYGHTCLQTLMIADSNVESFPHEGLLPPSLVSLTIYQCSNLRTLEHRGLCHLKALEKLRLLDCPKLQKLPKEGLPNTLSVLEIGGCHSLSKRCQKPKGKDWDNISRISCVEIDDNIIT